MAIAFHRGLQDGQSVAAAIRRARGELRGSVDPVLRSPEAWAAFVAIGDGEWTTALPTRSVDLQTERER
jgi:CHAT domain-containing protein